MSDCRNLKESKHHISHDGLSNIEIEESSWNAK